MKKQIQILSILLTLPILGLSQNKFLFGANANTQFSFMSIKYSQFTTDNEEKVYMGIGYSFGLQTQYKFTEKVFFRSGLNYQQNKVRHIIDNIFWPDDFLFGTSHIQNDITMSFLVLPVDVGYLIKSKNEKINYVIGFGGMINMNLKNNTTVKVIHKNTDDRKLDGAENKVDASKYSLWLFGGIEKKIDDKLIIGVEPNLRFTPNKFVLYLYDSEAKTTFETGLTLRIRMN